MKESKVKIENSSDLYKLPLNVIKNTKIYNFEGKYFDKIYQEALKLERSGVTYQSTNLQGNKIKINFIQFEMCFQTEFGQKIAIVGSGKPLGDWNISNALSLDWSNGNIWSSKINSIESFEYKFVLIENEKVKKWESGNNRSFSLSEISNNLSNLKANDNVIIYENKDNETYHYNNATNTLKIVCVFRN